VSLTLGQVLRQAMDGPTADALHLSPHQWKTIRALAACRTSALGGQLFHCGNCGRDHFVAHSCRNRHCPQCQVGLALEWLEKQEATLLPIPIKALSLVFRGKFLHGLKERYGAGELEFHGALTGLATPTQFAGLLGLATKSKWVVYAKKPFAGPKQVLTYLSRYTHRVAISNRRLISSDAQSVVFDFKDYADGSRHKTITLDRSEFVRRFCLHILPKRFVKIRHYGLLGNRNRQERLKQARQFLATVEKTDAKEKPKKNDSKIEPLRCPFCQKPTLIFVREVASERTHQPAKPLDSS